MDTLDGVVHPYTTVTEMQSKHLLSGILCGGRKLDDQETLYYVRVGSCY